MNRVRLSGALVGLAGTFALSTASAQEPPLPGLSWQAPEGCPQVAAVRERVRAITSPTARESRLQAAGEITKEDGRFHLKLVVRDGGLVGERNITSDSCEDLTGAAAVALGLLLRSEAPLTASELSGTAATDSGAATEPSAPASKPPPAEETAPPKPTPAPARPRAVTSRRFRALLRAPAIMADFGPLPKPSPGFGLGAGVSYEQWRLLLAGALWLEQSLPAQHRPSYGADAARKSLALSVGRGFMFRSVELAPCMTLALEHLTARGFGPGVVPSQQSAVWLSAGAGVLAAWHLGETAALVAEVGGRVEASRPIIAIDGLGDVQQLAPLSLNTVLAAEWSF